MEYDGGGGGGGGLEREKKRPVTMRDKKMPVITVSATSLIWAR